MARLAALVLALSCATFGAGAQTEADLQAAQDTTFAAFLAGDTALALKNAEHATALARTMSSPPPGRVLRRVLRR